MKGICCRTSHVALAAVALLFVVAVRSASAQTCDEFDECTINGTCQPNGTCVGTPKPDNTTCDDANPCTINDKCVSGSCKGTADPTKVDQPCDLGITSPCFVGTPTCKDLDPGPSLNLLCVPTFKQCTQDANKCTTEVCSFLTGACTSVPISCDTSCSTGTCDASTGLCVNETPRPNGFTCSDGNVCSTGETCQGGVCTAGATPTPTKTVTAGGATPTRTPTRTSTAVAATPTRTATSNGTATRTPTSVPASCFGDCNGNGVVDSADLAKIRSTMLRCGPCPGGVPGGVAAGCAAASGGCPAADYDSDGCLRAGDLTRVVSNLFEDPTGCPAGPNGPSVARRSVGVLQSSTSAFLILPRLVGAILGPTTGLLGGSGGGATQFLTLPFTCPTSGGGTLQCDQDFSGGFPPVLGPPTYTVTLNNCKATTATGRTVTVNGVLTALGQEGAICGTVPSPLQISANNLTVEEVGSEGSLSATFTSFSAVVNLSGDDANCLYDDFSMELSGGLTVTTKNGTGTTLTSTQLNFGVGSTVDLLVFQYGAECTPIDYQMSVDGDLVLNNGGNAVAMTFSQYQLQNDATGGGNLVDVNGTLSSACLGGTVQFLGLDTLSIAAGAPCPTAGGVQVEYEKGNIVDDAIAYGASNLTIDKGNNGSVDETFASCLDPALYVCPAP
jgi:hypothetical protein